MKTKSKNIFKNRYIKILIAIISVRDKRIACHTWAVKHINAISIYIYLITYEEAKNVFQNNLRDH